MCVEKNEPIANKDTYIHDVTLERYIFEFDRDQPTTVNSYNVDSVHDDIANVSKYEASMSEPQSCGSKEVESFVYDDEFNISDLRHMQKEEYDSYSFQSLLVELSSHVDIGSTVDDERDSVDQQNMQEMNYLVERLHYVENIIKSEVERSASQYEYEKSESCVSSDQGEVVDPMHN